MIDPFAIGFWFWNGMNLRMSHVKSNMQAMWSFLSNLDLHTSGLIHGGCADYAGKDGYFQPYSRLHHSTADFLHQWLNLFAHEIFNGQIHAVLVYLRPKQFSYVYIFDPNFQDVGAKDNNSWPILSPNIADQFLGHWNYIFAIRHIPLLKLPSQSRSFARIHLIDQRLPTKTSLTKTIS